MVVICYCCVSSRTGCPGFQDFQSGLLSPAHLSGGGGRGGAALTIYTYIHESECDMVEYLMAQANFFHSQRGVNIYLYCFYFNNLLQSKQEKPDSSVVNMKEFKKIINEGR